MALVEQRTFFFIEYNITTSEICIPSYLSSVFKKWGTIWGKSAVFLAAIRPDQIGCP